jgi:hypothetical protein
MRLPGSGITSCPSCSFHILTIRAFLPLKLTVLFYALHPDRELV